MPHRDLTIKLGMVTVPYDGSMGREERVHARSNRILTAKGAKQSLEWTQHMQDTEYAIEAQAARTSTADLPSPAVTAKHGTQWLL